MPWLFSAAAGTGTGAAAGTAAGAGTAGGIGAGLGTIGGTGTFGGLGVGGSGAGLAGVGSGASLLGGAAPAYGAGTLASLLASPSPSLVTGAGSLTGAAAGSSPLTAMMQPSPYRRVADAALQAGQQDLLDGLLSGLTLSGMPAGPAGGGERGVAPQQLPNQVGAMPTQQNRGRMGFNANGILSWLPQTPQIPQVASAPGQLPPLGAYRG